MGRRNSGFGWAIAICVLLVVVAWALSRADGSRAPDAVEGEAAVQMMAVPLAKIDPGVATDRAASPEESAGVRVESRNLGLMERGLPLALGNTGPRERDTGLMSLSNIGTRRRGSSSTGSGECVPSQGLGFGGDPRARERKVVEIMSVFGAALGESDAETYDPILDNPFLDTKENPLSTFSIDVDTASYANVRRILNQGFKPDAGAVRIEEMVNYFNYAYPVPTGEHPFSVNVEIAACPWETKHRLARIGLKGKEIPREERVPSNLVFLIDVSGSMQPANKLPLLKRAFKLLTGNLDESDRVAIVVYAGSSGLVLDSTPAADRRTIVDAVERLQARGSTNGGQGIQLAYRTAEANFIQGGNNRVILATDGDFNVGTTSQPALIDLVEAKAKSGVFLTVLGFGMGNLKDSTLEKLADKGNGNYGYIDSFKEARKVFGDKLTGTLFTIAKDVKIQVEFNPATVAGYRLIGYENRLLAKEDFNDDTKDAGEIGAGHMVTALYEIVPAGVPLPKAGNVDELKYQTPPRFAPAAHSGETMTVKLRYKQPDGDTSRLLSVPVTDDGKGFDAASDDFRFAASVAAFGMLLRGSPHKGSASYDTVIELANSAKGKDEYGYRAELVDLVRTATSLD